MNKNKNSFFRFFWPSLLAVMVVATLSFFAFVTFMTLIISDFIPSTERNKIEPQSVLHIQLDGIIRERSESKIDLNTMSVNNFLGLTDVLYGLERAKKDTNIHGIFLELGDFSCGLATSKEIRRALKDFKKSGKFIVAYNSGEYVPLNKYYISACADELYGFPTSNLSFMGLGNELVFFKNTFKKLGLEVEIIKGQNNDFKSAVEPFFLDKMSDSSRRQMQVYLDNIWNEMIGDIAKDRQLNTHQLNEYADQLTVRSVNDAVRLKLFDGAKYRDEVITMLKNKIGIKPDAELNTVHFEKYAKSMFKRSQSPIKLNEPNIAVIVAEGDIAVNGKGISSKKICKLIEEARNNKTVKTIVLRINSPGGSALASEEIWREITLTNSEKPIVVSMGNVAASGGYYIAAPASRIFAESTTITGSIGVFGMIPYTGNFMKDKLGLSFDYVQTNQHQTLSLNRKLTPEELQILQQEVDHIYTDFVNKVADGRKLTVEQTKKIARGRVWTGNDAVKIGLVDEIGGLNDAIAYAAKKANIKNVKVLHYPSVKTEPLESILEQFNEEQVLTANQGTITQELLQQYQNLTTIEQLVGVQMRLPFLFDSNYR